MNLERLKFVTDRIIQDFPHEVRPVLTAEEREHCERIAAIYQLCPEVARPIELYIRSLRCQVFELEQTLEEMTNNEEHF